MVIIIHQTVVHGGEPLEIPNEWDLNLSDFVILCCILLGDLIEPLNVFLLVKQLVNGGVCLREDVQAEELDFVVLQVFDAERLFLEGFNHFPMVEGKACLNDEPPIFKALMILVVDPEENIVKLDRVGNLMDILC